MLMEMIQLPLHSDSKCDALNILGAKTDIVQQFSTRKLELGEVTAC